MNGNHEQRATPPRRRVLSADNVLTAALIVLIPAITIRILLTLSQPLILWPDSIAYLVWGGKIVEHAPLESYPIYRTPLYSLFLSAFVRFGWSGTQMTAIVAGQHVLGAMTVCVVYLCGRLIFNPRVALGAAFLFGIHGLQLYYEQVAMTETLFILLLWSSVAMLAWIMRRPSPVSAASLGMLLGLTALARPIGEPLVLLAVLTLALRYRWRPSLLLPPLAAFLLTISPWLIANHEARGYWGLSRELGINLFHRVIDADGADLPPDTEYPAVDAMIHAYRGPGRVVYFSVWHQLMREQHSSLVADSLMLKSALEALRADPGRYVRNSLTTWIGFFMDAWVSIDVCRYQQRDLLCALSRAAPVPAVEEQIQSLDPGRAALTAPIPGTLNLPMGALSILAAIGAMLALCTPSKERLMQLVVVGVIVMFATLTALFNRQDDRFRLPVDAGIILLAVSAGERAIRLATKRQPAAPNRS